MTNPYIPTTWVDLTVGATPGPNDTLVNAARLNNMESGIVSANQPPGEGTNLVYVQFGAGSYTDSGGHTLYIGSVDPMTFTADPATINDEWDCPGSGRFYVGQDGQWHTISTYAAAADPYAGGGTGGVNVVYLDHPTLTQGTAYASGAGIQFTATGSTGVYTWTIDSTPPGMTLHSSTGLMDGTPTSPGSYPVTITATSVASTGGFSPPVNIGTGGRNAAGTTAVPITVSQAVAVGDIVLIAVASSVVATLTAGFGATDNLGNTYTLDASQLQSTSAQSAILSSRVTTAGTLTTVTLSLTNSASNITADVSVVKGGLASGAYKDQTATGGSTSGSTTVATSATGTQAASGDLAFFAAGTFNSAGTVTVPSPWVKLGSATSSSGTNDRTVTAAYQILGSTAAVTGTETTAASGAFSACVATYKAGTGTTGGGGAIGSKAMVVVVNASSGPGNAGQYAPLGVQSTNGSATDNNGNPGFNTMKADLGTWLTYARYYYNGAPPSNWSSNSPGSGIAALGLIPVPNSTIGDISGILAGDYDAAFISFAASLPSNAIFTCQHEPDHNSKFTVSQWTSSYNHIMGIMRAHAPTGVLLSPAFVCANVTSNYKYANGSSGLDLTLVDMWGLDTYPSVGQTLQNRVGAHAGYLQAIKNVPFWTPEMGLQESGSTLVNRVVESLKWMKSATTGPMMYFTGQAGASPYFLTSAQWSAVAASLTAGN